MSEPSADGCENGPDGAPTPLGCSPRRRARSVGCGCRRRAGGSDQAPVASSTGRHAAAACEPSPTRPEIDLAGRPTSSPLRLLGEAPVLVGPFRGSRAALRVSTGFGSKFYYLLDPAGPSQVSVIVRRRDAPGRGLFEIYPVDARGRVVRRWVPVLRLDRERVRGENPPRRGHRWLGQPGSVRLPALGCYELRVRWAGGGWSRIFRAVPDPLLWR